MVTTVPRFYLYGEPHRSVEDGFVHVESLHDRSRPSAWTIRPHSHAELAHIFYLSSGGGDMVIDARVIACRAPCLLLVPACVTHGFRWEEETGGSVVTLATPRLSGLAWLAPDTADVLTEPDAVALSPAEALKVERCIEKLMLELGWARVGHDAAVQSALLSILIVALRERMPQRQASRGGGRQKDLVARMRHRIERRYRQREPVATYARALGTSETALRLACAMVAGLPPAAMIDQRTLLEARRSLIFSDLSVGEISFSLGFDNPSYFSRFFARHVGRSPRNYRSDQRARVPDDDRDDRSVEPLT